MLPWNFPLMYLYLRKFYNVFSDNNDYTNFDDFQTDQKVKPIFLNRKEHKRMCRVNWFVRTICVKNISSKRSLRTSWRSRYLFVFRLTRIN